MRARALEGPTIIVAPFFCLARAAWMPYACTWDAETGALRGVEGPRGFATYREAVEASRFLVCAPTSPADFRLHTY
jgi:hypothetical protein